jgi:hypothetical protein
MAAFMDTEERVSKKIEERVTENQAKYSGC